MRPASLFVQSHAAMVRRVMMSPCKPGGSGQSRLCCRVPPDHPMPDVIEVRGEVFIPNDVFEKINTQRESAGEPPFANARNATTGTLKNLDLNIVAARRLGFIAHGRGETQGVDATRYSEFRSLLEKLGVPVEPHCRVCRSIEQIIAAVEEFEPSRISLNYGVDGMVIRVDRFDLQEQLGSTSKAPRWCIAYKYPAEQGITTLERIDWQVGKGGTLTPRATMQPIFIAGTTVQHATLHNIEEISSQGHSHWRHRRHREGRRDHPAGRACG